MLGEFLQLAAFEDVAQLAEWGIRFGLPGLQCFLLTLLDHAYHPNLLQILKVLTNNIHNPLLPTLVVLYHLPISWRHLPLQR